MVCCVFENETVKKLNSISLSIDTVQRRNEEMSVDILLQVFSDICRSESGFAIQLDESTDVTNCALFRFNCTDVTNGEFFFKEHGLKWENLKGCRTDGAPAMLGRKSGFRARVMKVAHNVIFLHCMIPRFALSCKVLPAKPFDVLHW